MTLIGKILIVTGIALMFLAYSNFLPTSLSTPKLADYVKNHFVREVIFGLALACLTIYLTINTSSTHEWLKVAVLGSIVVLPFWVASAFGWSTGGLQEVWGDNIKPNAAYMLHGTQTALFYIGVGVLFFGVKNT